MNFEKIINQVYLTLKYSTLNLVYILHHIHKNNALFIVCDVVKKKLLFTIKVNYDQ